jgi:hypothetical protein
MNGRMNASITASIAASGDTCNGTSSNTNNVRPLDRSPAIVEVAGVDDTTFTGAFESPSVTAAEVATAGVDGASLTAGVAIVGVGVADGALTGDAH